MRWRFLPMLVAGALVAGCATTVTTGAFTQVSRIESQLRRGVSTKMDVQRVLGTPKGTGSALLPTDPQPREVWLYSDIAVTGARGEGPGVLRANVRQQVLLVTFEKGVFDGYMWFSNAGTAVGE